MDLCSVLLVIDVWGCTCGGVMYLVFTRMPGESYRRQLGSLSLYFCYVFWALISSLVCWCLKVVKICLVITSSYSKVIVMLDFMGLFKSGSLPTLWGQALEHAAEKLPPFFSSRVHLSLYPLLLLSLHWMFPSLPNDVVLGYSKYLNCLSTQPTRELTRAQKTSHRHNNKDLSHLR